LKSLLNQNGFDDHYRALKKIGKGSFASVYQVENITEGVNYAAKAFSKEAAYSEDKGK
jgi:calcium-dependent protein kinase